MEAMDKVRWGELNAVQKLFAEKPFSVKRYEVSDFPTCSNCTV